MKKYFKKDSNIEINFGDTVAFVKSGEFNGMNTYTKIEGEITPDNIDDLIGLGYVDVKEVKESDTNKCECKGSDFDLDKAISDLEKICEILQKYIG